MDSSVAQYLPKSVNFKRKRFITNPSTTLPTKTKSLTSKYPRFQSWMNHRLYEQYASTQNYYYLKDINTILEAERSPSYIRYKDMEGEIEAINSLVLTQRFNRQEYLEKITELTEYYKFHREIPRIFSKNEYDIYFDYHDRKRRFEYFRITNDLKIRNGEDPFIQRKIDRIRKRNTRFAPLLADLTKYSNSSMTKKESRLEGESLLDVIDKLHRIVTVESKEQSFSLDLDITVEKPRDAFAHKKEQESTPKKVEWPLTKKDVDIAHQLKIEPLMKKKSLGTIVFNIPQKANLGKKKEPNLKSKNLEKKMGLGIRKLSKKSSKSKSKLKQKLTNKRTKLSLASLRGTKSGRVSKPCHKKKQSSSKFLSPDLLRKMSIGNAFLDQEALDMIKQKVKKQFEGAISKSKPGSARLGITKHQKTTSDLNVETIIREFEPLRRSGHFRFNSIALGEKGTLNQQSSQKPSKKRLPKRIHDRVMNLENIAKDSVLMRKLSACSWLSASKLHGIKKAPHLIRKKSIKQKHSRRSSKTSPIGSLNHSKIRFQKPKNQGLFDLRRSAEFLKIPERNQGVLAINTKEKKKSKLGSHKCTKSETMLVDNNLRLSHNFNVGIGSKEPFKSHRAHE